MNATRTRERWPQDDERRPPRRPRDANEPMSDEERRKRLKELWERLNDRKQRTWTPWLLLRAVPSDVGLRPLASGIAHWKSPDLWVESSDALGNPVEGQENFVHARVLNLGKADADPTRVDFYWADPSLGLTADTFTPIGTEWVVAKARTALDVRCNRPWVPVMVNGGHECLLVNCTNPILDPIQQPFLPRLDRHVGQRNVHVVSAPAGAKIDLSVTLTNLLPGLGGMVMAKTRRLVSTPTGREAPARTLVDLAAAGTDRLDQPAVLHTLYAEGTLEHRQAVRLASFRASRDKETALLRAKRQVAAPRIQAAFAGEVERLRPLGGAADIGRLLTGAALLRHPGGDDDGTVVLEHGFDADTRRRVDLRFEVPDDAETGELIAYDVAQWSAGILVGGYTVVVRVEPSR